MNLDDPITPKRRTAAFGGADDNCTHSNKTLLNAFEKTI